jgi:hypothetical protein
MENEVRWAWMNAKNAGVGAGPKPAPASRRHDVADGAAYRMSSPGVMSTGSGARRTGR